MIAAITGIVRTSILFWLPTYFNERLGFSETKATMIFTVVSLFISCGSFIVIFIYEVMGHKLDQTVLLMFSASAIFFAATYFIKFSYLNIAFIVLSIMASNGASTMLWSRYCPSLRDTGIVSSVTGFLDFLSYGAAATANIIFPFLIEKRAWSWENIVLLWLAFVTFGVVISLPWRRWIGSIKTKKQ